MLGARGTDALVLLLLVSSLSASSAFAQRTEQGADPIGAFAAEVCSESPSRLDSLAAAFKSRSMPTLDVDRLKTIVAMYHPATRDARSSIDVVARGSALPSATELGSEHEWNGVSLQTDLLRQHAFGESDCAAPIARFDKGPAHLSFIAAAHVVRERAARQPVFRAIKSEFDSVRPGAAVVEGYPERFPCDEAVRIYLTPADRLGSEPEYVAKLALDRGAMIYGGEPDGLGLSQADSERFQLLRELSAHQSLGLRAAFRAAQRAYPFGASITLSDFKAWYRRLNGRNFKLENAWDDLAPSFNMARPRGTNRLADQIDLKRDAHVTQTIRTALLTQGKVLVVYGSDHFPRQLPVFESVFGRVSTPAAKCSCEPGVAAQPASCQ